ncbi:MAG: hypothetical protein U0401_18365 [Anaerolineae bacterium]
MTLNRWKITLTGTGEPGSEVAIVVNGKVVTRRRRKAMANGVMKPICRRQL